MAVSCHLMLLRFLMQSAVSKGRPRQQEGLIFSTSISNTSTGTGIMAVDARAALRG